MDKFGLILCIVFFFLCSIISVNGQMNWRTDSVEEDNNDVNKPVSSSQQFWENSAPSVVNMIYTWVNPNITSSQSGSITTVNVQNPSVSITAGYPPQPTTNKKINNNRGGQQKQQQHWSQSINNRPSGGNTQSSSSSSGSNKNSGLFHPHFGPILPWERDSKISRVGDGIYIVERGVENDASYLMFYKNETGLISPFHDIPLFANEGNKIFNMVVEVPRWTNAKMEIATKEPLNPIKQDTKKGKLRFVANVFPHHGYIWNYGAIPQTWENPNHIDESTGEKGDNDPIDVCEIGYRVAKPGEVLQIKVLGVLAMLDEGETDWKVVAIDVNDPLAPQLSDINDVEKHMPGFLKATVEWFKLYKVPDGKPENHFAFNGEAKNREFAHQIIMGTHVEWRDLIAGKSDKGELDIGSLTVPTAAAPLTSEAATAILEASAPHGAATPLEAKVDQWHYVNLK